MLWWGDCLICPAGNGHFSIWHRNGYKIGYFKGPSSVHYLNWSSFGNRLWSANAHGLYNFSIKLIKEPKYMNVEVF